MPNKYKKVDRAVPFADFCETWKKARGDNPFWHRNMMTKWEEIKDDAAVLEQVYMSLKNEIKKKEKAVNQQQNMMQKFFGSRKPSKKKLNSKKQNNKKQNKIKSENGNISKLQSEKNQKVQNPQKMKEQKKVVNNREYTKPAQDREQRNIVENVKKIEHLKKEYKKTNRIDCKKLISEDISKAEKSVEISNRKLKLLKRKAENQCSLRKRRKLLLEKAGQLDASLLPKKVGRPRLDDHHEDLLSTIEEIAIEGNGEAAADPKRRSELTEAYISLDSLHQKLVEQGYKISRSGTYLYIRIIP